MQILNLKKDKIDYKNKLNYNNWKQKNKKQFEKLFICYATYQELGGKSKNVDFGVTNLCKSPPNDDTLCPNEINLRITDLYNELKESGCTSTQITQVENKIKSNASHCDFMKFVSGKSLLRILIHKRMNRVFQGQIKNEYALKKLAEGVSVDFDPELRQAIFDLCK